MSDREKNQYSKQYDYSDKAQSESSSVEDIPSPDANEADKVKGGFVNKPVMLPPKPDQY